MPWRAVAGVGAIAAVGLLGEAVLPRGLWRKRSTEIVDNGGDWLAFSGLGQDSGQYIASSLDQSLGPIDYASYSHRGINPRSIGRALTSYYDHRFPDDGPAKSQNLLVCSMGLPTGLKGIEWCIKNKVKVPPIDNVVAISSPLSVNDTYLHKPALLIAGSHYPGGIFSKAVLEFGNSCLYDGFSLPKLGNHAWRAIKSSYTGHSPNLWTRQIALLCKSRKFEDNIFDGVITDSTTFYHLGNDEADRSVKITKARASLEAFLEPYGAKLIPIDTPDMAHADVAAARPYIKGIVGGLLDRSD